MIAVTKRTGIDGKDVQTSEISIYPQYDYVKDKHVFNGYRVTNTLFVTLKDLSKFEGFLGDLLAVGANSVQGVSFGSSELPKHKAQARKMAVKAAKEKAESIAGELGQKIGRPFTITDQDNFGSYVVPMANARAGLGGNPAEGDVSSNLAPGQIIIRQSVSVSFELQ
jgi:uncharacterized protein YggE